MGNYFSPPLHFTSSSSDDGLLLLFHSPKINALILTESRTDSGTSKAQESYLSILLYLDMPQIPDIIKGQENPIKTKPCKLISCNLLQYRFKFLHKSANQYRNFKHELTQPRILPTHLLEYTSLQINQKCKMSPFDLKKAPPPSPSSPPTGGCGEGGRQTHTYKNKCNPS